MKAGLLSEPVLVGRERELEWLESFLNSAIEGKGKTVFISGEAGAGKTRLTREFLNAAKKRGIGLMAGWCLSDAEAPYFPFVEAFHAYFASFSENEQPASLLQPGTPLSVAGTAQMIGAERGIAAWLSGPTPLEKPGKAEAVSPQVWKDQVYAGVAGTLHSISARAPVILFIEDIHWADSASLALMHYIARAVDSKERILVLATFRSEELTADAEGHPHPLAETLRMMRREDLFTEIKLPDLNQAHVSKIAENMIGGSLQIKLAEKLAAESRGNPLFVVESLRMLNQSKSLVQENNEWRLSIDELGIPFKIKDIILRRLAVLKFAQRRVLDAAAVIGEKFEVDLLSTVLGLDYLEVLETLNVIARSTSLVCVDENYYKFDHARSRETLYGELSPPLKRGYHGKIAEKLEAKGGNLPLSDLAYHYAQAGNTEKTLKYSVAAAQDELAKFSNQQAIQHFKYALEKLPPDSSEQKRAVLEGLGDAYCANSMYAEAIKTFNQLAAQESGAVKLRAIRKAMDAAFLKGDKPALLLDYAKKAEELVQYDRLEMARVINNRGRAFGWAGQGSAKLDLTDYDTALHIFEEENSVADLADALWRSGVVCTMFSDLREKGLSELLRSIAIFRELGDIRKEIEATLYSGVGFGVSGLHAEARQQFREVLRLGEKLDVFSELAQASSSLSNGYERQGDLNEAISLCMQALEYCKKTDVGWVETTVWARLVRIYSKLGDIKNAQTFLDKLNASSNEALETSRASFEIAGAKAVYFAANGQWEECNKFFQKFFEILSKSKPNDVFPNMEIIGRSHYLWCLEKQGRVDESKLQIERINQLIEQSQERFAHANMQTYLMAKRKLNIGDEFEVRLDIVNIARSQGMLLTVEGLLTPEFEMRGRSFDEAQGKTVNPFHVETIKLKLKATKTGIYTLAPTVLFKDELGETKAIKPNQITITVQPALLEFEVLSGRISTGYSDLDRLLLGGIPQNHAVILSSPSIDERELLVRKFLEAGADAGEITYLVTAEPGSANALAEEHPSNFYLLVCNPQAEAIIQNLPNVFKLKGVENLTEIDIALIKMFRQLNPAITSPRRICVEILSDALLQHHAVNTRRWLSALLPTLKSKGFTVLAVINPQMHPPEESQAIRSLFDGEIEVAEKGLAKILRVKRFANQRYLEEELVLVKEKLFS